MINLNSENTFLKFVERVVTTFMAYSLVFAAFYRRDYCNCAIH